MCFLISLPLSLPFLFCLLVSSFLCVGFTSAFRQCSRSSAVTPLPDIHCYLCLLSGTVSDAHCYVCLLSVTVFQLVHPAHTATSPLPGRAAAMSSHRGSCPDTDTVFPQPGKGTDVWTSTCLLIQLCHTQEDVGFVLGSFRVHWPTTLDGICSQIHHPSGRVETALPSTCFHPVPHVPTLLPLNHGGSWQLRAELWQLRASPFVDGTRPSCLVLSCSKEDCFLKEAEVGPGPDSPRSPGGTLW